MSNNVVISVIAVKGRVLDFIQHAEPSLFYLSDFAPYRTRSFVLLMLHEVGDFRGPVGTSLADVPWEHLSNLNWHRDNVDRYVESMEVLGCERLVTRPDEEAMVRAALDARPKDALKLLPRARCRARVTDARWLSNLRKGKVFGVAGYDVWFEDTARV